MRFVIQHDANYYIKNVPGEAQMPLAQRFSPSTALAPVLIALVILTRAPGHETRKKKSCSAGISKFYMLTKLYPSDRARLLDEKIHFEQALRLQAQLIPARQFLEQPNKILGKG
jgi:hypothetical protein